MKYRIYGLMLMMALSHTAWGWYPGTSASNAISGFTVNTADRIDVLAFYNTVYNASEDFPNEIQWTGSVVSKIPGTTTAVFKDSVRRRINFYRALVGLPTDIVFNDTKSAKCQSAALIFSANNMLSHHPSSSWLNYSIAGADAASNSNLAWGSSPAIGGSLNYGPGAVDGYMLDEGANNAVVGHRRWLLYSRANEMGTGDVPQNGSYGAANAIWVIGDFKASATPKLWHGQMSVMCHRTSCHLDGR